MRKIFNGILIMQKNLFYLLYSVFLSFCLIRFSNLISSFANSSYIFTSFSSLDYLDMTATKKNQTSNIFTTF